MFLMSPHFRKIVPKATKVSMATKVLMATKVPTATKVPMATKVPIATKNTMYLHKSHKSHIWLHM